MHEQRAAISSHFVFKTPLSPGLAQFVKTWMEDRFLFPCYRGRLRHKDLGVWIRGHIKALIKTQTHTHASLNRARAPCPQARPSAFCPATVCSLSSVPTLSQPPRAWGGVGIVGDVVRRGRAPSWEETARRQPPVGFPVHLAQGPLLCPTSEDQMNT